MSQKEAILPLQMQFFLISKGAKYIYNPYEMFCVVVIDGNTTVVCYDENNKRHLIKYTDVETFSHETVATPISEGLSSLPAPKELSDEEWIDMVLKDYKGKSWYIYDIQEQKYYKGNLASGYIAWEDSIQGHTVLNSYDTARYHLTILEGVLGKSMVEIRALHEYNGR